MGTIIVGKIESGKVKKGQTVLVMPNRVNITYVFQSFEMSLMVSYWLQIYSVRLKLRLFIMKLKKKYLMAFAEITFDCEYGALKKRFGFHQMIYDYYYNCYI